MQPKRQKCRANCRAPEREQQESASEHAASIEHFLSHQSGALRSRPRVGRTPAFTCKAPLNDCPRSGHTLAPCLVQGLVRQHEVVHGASLSDGDAFRRRDDKKKPLTPPTRTHCSEDTATKVTGEISRMPKRFGAPLALQSPGMFASISSFTGIGSQVLPSSRPIRMRLGQSQHDSPPKSNEAAWAGLGGLSRSPTCASNHSIGAARNRTPPHKTRLSTASPRPLRRARVSLSSVNVSALLSLPNT